MSLEAYQQVWKNHRAENRSQLVMLLALADHAHDDGTNVFMLMENLALKTLYDSERGVRLVLEKLIKTVQIVCHPQKGPGGTNLIDMVYGDGSNWSVIEDRCKKYKTPLPVVPLGEESQFPPPEEGFPPPGRGIPPGGNHSSPPLRGNPDSPITINHNNNQKDNPGASSTFDPDHPYLLTIQRQLGCQKYKKTIKKNLHKDQWLEIQAKITEDSQFWFWCEENARNYDVGKQGIAHWMEVVLDKEAYRGWLGEVDDIAPPEKPEIYYPSVNAGKKNTLEDHHPSTIPGEIRDTNQLQQGVSYESLKRWGFTDHHIASLKPAPPAGIMSELTAREVFEQAGVAWPGRDESMDVSAMGTREANESSDLLPGDG